MSIPQYDCSLHLEIAVFEALPVSEYPLPGAPTGGRYRVKSPVPTGNLDFRNILKIYIGSPYGSPADGT